jgi:hypothetical protein
MTPLDGHSDMNSTMPVAGRDQPLGAEPGTTMRRRAPVVDLADVSCESACVVSAKMQTVRIDGNSRLLIPFTTHTPSVDLHYVEASAVRSYVHCSGEGCLLCELGKSREQRHLLPVYDPIAGTVVVLPISPNLRPGALLTKLRPIFARVKRGERVIMDIRTPGRGEYVVSDLPIPDSGEDGAAVIGRFVAAYEAGEADLTNVYQQMPRDMLLQVPEIAREARLKGIAQ